jgi:hypothetical protein
MLDYKWGCIDLFNDWCSTTQLLSLIVWLIELLLEILLVKFLLLDVLLHCIRGEVLLLNICGLLLIPNQRFVNVGAWKVLITCDIFLNGSDASRMGLV